MTLSGSVMLPEVGHERVKAFRHVGPQLGVQRVLPGMAVEAAMVAVEYPRAEVGQMDLSDTAQLAGDRGVRDTSRRTCRATARPSGCRRPSANPGRWCRDIPSRRCLRSADTCGRSDPAPAGAGSAPGCSAGSHSCSSAPATHATGTPGTASARNRHGPKLTAVTTFSFFGSNSRTTRPSQPSVPTLSASQVCQMSIERKCERGESR